MCNHCDILISDRFETTELSNHETEPECMVYDGVNGFHSHPNLDISNNYILQLQLVDFSIYAF